jgi:hypothetical protein
MYEKQTWNTGDVITEEKLNHMEDGIASCGMFVVGSIYDENTQTTTLDKTYKEIVDAFNAGRNVVLKTLVGDRTNIDPLVSYGSYNNNMLGVGFYALGNKIVVTFSADSENSYPSYEDNGEDGR